jgi:chemotaxis methyl-accepting protein methylase
MNREQTDRASEIEYDFKDIENINPYTRFFREPGINNPEQLLKLINPLRNILIIGSSSGEEPLSLAIALNQLNYFSFHITAIDASNKLVEKAREGKYQVEIDWNNNIKKRQNTIPAEIVYNENYFNTGPIRGDNITITASENLKNYIDYYARDARRPLQLDNLFDLIICNNVLIHFPKKDKDIIIANLLEELRPLGGLLFEMEERFGVLTSLGRTYMLEEYNNYFANLANHKNLNRLNSYILGRLFIKTSK